ncbi:MAG: hypothetical protein AAFR16_10595, partial [Pseudomonadota bacterium]
MNQSEEITQSEDETVAAAEKPEPGAQIAPSAEKAAEEVALEAADPAAVPDAADEAAEKVAEEAP